MIRRASSSAATTSSGVTLLPTLSHKTSGLPKAGKGQRVTLTSKHNWWLIDVEDGDTTPPLTPRTPIERPPVDVSPPQFIPAPHPTSIFGHPAPTSGFNSSTAGFPFPAPQNPTARLAPIATGSTSELFKCIVKKPDIVQMEINGEMQTNSPDVTAQFLAELRVYTTISGHRNFPAYLGALDGVGMVLEFIDGRSLLDVLKAGQSAGDLDHRTKINFHDQLLDGLSYLHSFGLSHGDLSLLNILVTRTNTLKILDFGRSTSITSTFSQPSEPSPEPDIPIFAPPPRPTMSRTTSQAVSIPSESSGRSHHHTITLQLNRSPTPSPPLTPRLAPRKVERIHPGTRPFSAPEILREECTDPILADAYSFGMILYCIDVGGLVDVNPAAQQRWELPDLRDCELFSEAIRGYLQEPWKRKRISRDDFLAIEVSSP